MGFDLSRIGIVSDEIHTDPEIAFKVAHELNMGHVDLNSVWGKTVTDLSDDEVQKVKALLARYNLSVTMVAGLPFKSITIGGMTGEQLVASDVYAEHMRMLERSMVIARQLDAPLVRIHSFAWESPADGGRLPRWPGGGAIPWPELECIVEGLRPACDLAREYDVILGHENVRWCHGNSGRNMRRILDALNDDRFKIVWDPGNAYVSGEEDAVGAGYAAIRDDMVHFHMKDATVVDKQQHETKWARIGTGEVDYTTHLRDVLRDFSGGITLEPHWRDEGMDRETASRLSYDSLMQILKDES